MNRGQASDAILDSRLTGPQKLILLGYLKHQSSADAPDAGISWPGAKRLAEYAGVCEAVAIEHRGSMLTAGVLVVVEHDSGGNKRCRIDFTRFPTAEQAEAMEAARKGKRAHRARTPLGAADPGASDDATPSAATTPPLVAADPSPRSGRPLPSAATTPPLVAADPSPRSGRPNPSVENPPQGTLRREPSTGNRPQGTGGAEMPPNLVPSPPPAEPSGTSERWTQAADIIEADPESWRASDEFQPSSDAYVFDDADHDGVTEQPSIPRQIESPTQPFEPLEEFTPSPPPSASPAARPRGLSGEGVPGPASAPQSAPSLFGRTDTAPPPSAPAKALQRPRKAPPAPLPLTHPDNPQGKDGATLPYAFADGLTSEDVSEDGLTLWREWWRRQSAPARTKLDEGRAKYIRKALTTHKLDELLTLIRYAYDAPDLGPYQRAWRGADGKDRPPLDMLLRDENRQRNVDRARDWLDSTTDEATGLRILPPKPTPTVNGRPDKMSMIQNLLLKERQNAQSHCNP